MTSLSKMNVNQLRDTAVALGADRKKLYGTSKQSLIVIIDNIRKEYNSDPKFQKLMKDVDEYVKENYHPESN